MRRADVGAGIGLIDKRGQLRRATMNKVLLLLVATGLLSACSTKTVLRPNPQPQTSYEMVVPKGVLRYSLEPGETAIKPMPDRQVAPVYPASQVHPGAASVTVEAQLTMDRDGRVYGVHTVSNTDNGSSAALFAAAVESAAMQWTFTPLWMQRSNPDGTTTRTSVPFSLWYVYHFRVVDGRPIVETVKR